MMLPIVFSTKERATMKNHHRDNLAYADRKGYRVLWQSRHASIVLEDQGSGQINYRCHYPVAGFSILVSHGLRNAIVAAASIPRKWWCDLTHHFYYGRLAYQYERGVADGRRDVLANLDLYKDLTPEELAVITAQPDHK